MYAEKLDMMDDDCDIQGFQLPQYSIYDELEERQLRWELETAEKIRQEALKEGFIQAMEKFGIKENGEPFDKIRQEAIEEFRNGLLEEIEIKTYEIDYSEREGWRMGIKFIESYNLPIK